MKFLRDIKKYKKALLKNKTEPLENLILKAENSKITPGIFIEALRKRGMSLIAEVKLVSPSKGSLSKYSVEELAKTYEELNAAAVSVLTEDKYFLGSLDNITKVKSIFRGPILMKDFIISQYQIYEGVLAGAAGILLIAAMLSKKDLKKLLGVCKKLGISAIVEVHSKKELKKCLDLEDLEIIGVNSRNLKTLKVDAGIHEEIANLIPENLVKVAESGIGSGQRVKELYKLGYDAVLIGEGLVSSDDPKSLMAEIKSL